VTIANANANDCPMMYTLAAAGMPLPLICPHCGCDDERVERVKRSEVLLRLLREAVHGAEDMTTVTLCRSCRRVALATEKAEEKCQRCGKASVEPLNLDVAEDPKVPYSLTWMDGRLLRQLCIKA
jgi:hypothetical protein